MHIPDDTLFDFILDPDIAPLGSAHRQHFDTCGWCQYRVARERADNPFVKGWQPTAQPVTLLTMNNQELARAILQFLNIEGSEVTAALGRFLDQQFDVLASTNDQVAQDRIRHLESLLEPLCACRQYPAISNLDGLCVQCAQARAR